MFKNYQVFEITRPFWNHPQVQEDLSRHWKLSGNFKKRECKGNRNDLNENKIKNFIFVKIWPENLATTDWSFAGHLSILCDFWMVLLKWSRIFSCARLESATATNKLGTLVGKYLSELVCCALDQFGCQRVDNWEHVLASESLRLPLAGQNLSNF